MGLSNFSLPSRYSFLNFPTSHSLSPLLLLPPPLSLGLYPLRRLTQAPSSGGDVTASPKFGGQDLDMGGCCCSARKAQLHGTPVYYYCPPSLEDRETLRSFNGTASGLPAGFFVGLNLDTSSPDTFRPPPAPIPFTVLFGRSPTSVDSLGTQGKCDTQSVQSAAVTDTAGIDKRDISTHCGHVDKSEGRTLADILLGSPTKSDAEISKPCEFGQLDSEEEDVCPICLEEYDEENPKMVTDCEHDFHLSCLLEWMERSDSCPVCDKEMIFDVPDDQL